MTSGAHSLCVSVIIPVYNPGTHIDALITSLAEQTMPQSEFEVIFSDDGSTDETPQLLDRLAAERSNVRVLHEPNSGWPGRPRNLAMDISRGEYVFFVDQDDWLGVEALERMYRYAHDHSSDLIIGRYAGHKRTVAKVLFRQTRPDATLDNTPLIDSLTPHKMFRTAFLREHGLRFPEGRRRLEDHWFVVSSYLLAERIAVLADYHCYYHVRRDDEGNAGYQKIDPAGYYGNVREVIDVVFAHTTPGSTRDLCLRRTLRVELLARLDGRAFLAEEPEYQRALFDEARGVARDTMPTSVDAGMGAPLRVRAELLRAGLLDELIAVDEYYLRMKPVVRLNEMEWSTDASLDLVVEAHLVDSVTGDPWHYEIAGENVYLSGPEEIISYSRDVAECSKHLASSNAQIVLRRREDSQEWTVATESEAEVHRDVNRASVTIRAHGSIDPATLANGARLASGVWDVYVRISQTGWTREARLGAFRADAVTANRRAAVLSGGIALPYWTKPYDNVSLHLDASLGTALRHAEPADVVVRLHEDSWHRYSLGVRLPLVTFGTAFPTLSIRLADGSHLIDLPARIDASNAGELALTIDVPELSPGTWTMSATMAISPESGNVGASFKLPRLLKISNTGEAALVASLPTGSPRRTQPRTHPVKQTLPGRVRRKLGAIFRS